MHPNSPPLVSFKFQLRKWITFTRALVAGIRTLSSFVLHVFKFWKHSSQSNAQVIVYVNPQTRMAESNKLWLPEAPTPTPKSSLDWLLLLSRILIKQSPKIIIINFIIVFILIVALNWMSLDLTADYENWQPFLFVPHFHMSISKCNKTILQLLLLAWILRLPSWPKNPQSLRSHNLSPVRH